MFFQQHPRHAEDTVEHGYGELAGKGVLLVGAQECEAIVFQVFLGSQLTVMVREMSRHQPETGSRITARRTRLASLLFAILRPWDARAVTVDANMVSLSFASRFTDLSLGEIERADLVAGKSWTAIRLHHATGNTTVSGLSPNDAKVMADALESMRVDWWRRALTSQIESLNSVQDSLAQLADPPKYVNSDLIGDLRRNAQKAAGGFEARWPSTLSNTPEIQMLKGVLDFLEAPEHARTKANEAFVANELIRSRGFFDRVEAQPLTDEQRRAVVVDDHRNLVVAAAGSGKTSVIVAKAGWLVSRGYRRPSELLLLAFASDARKEMEGRLRRRLGSATAGGLTVRTFHSLGMAIIGEAEGKRPSLAKSAENDRALFDLLKGIVTNLLTGGELSSALLEWFQDWFAPYKKKHEFRSWGEYWDYIRRHDIRSLRGETVKSYEECEIANFLYLHGVAYEYEAPYRHDTATAEKRQYQPDFYLTKAGIYIEHFGLDADGNTAPFVDREEYLQGMAWKRQIHAEHGTVLIETFSHERADGTLISKLAEKLIAHGVTLSQIPRNKVFAVLERQGRVDPFTRLLATFLQHFKGARLSFSDVSTQADTLQDGGRAKMFLSVFRPIYERYQETLSRAGEIDFHDMINRATDLVEAGKYRSPFGYILVDEFQDISPARAKLLQALLKQSPTTQLFAVGDDWQAIFRFGGSDIALMREFDKHFGDSERMDLETTFRCSDRIAAVATDFVLRNPAQIRKTVRSVNSADGPSVHVGLPGDETLSMLREALDNIADDAAKHTGISDVLLLGRYRHSRPQNIAELAQRYPGLRLSCMTMHRSKGLEADYVVVLGLCSGKYGFPAEIADDPLLDLALAVPEGHPNAEERRLLYVAITRARRQVFLLADGGPPSSFAKELVDDGYDITVFGRQPDGDVACPICVEGRLERRENTRNESFFFGCSNWPLCEHRQRPCQSCGKGLLVKGAGAYRCRDCGESMEGCPVCDGWLVTRIGPYGRFLGCSNFPKCGYTRDFEREQRARRRSQKATGHEKQRRH